MGLYSFAIEKLYIAYFNRPADVAGMAYWESVVSGMNGDTSLVSAAFAASDEYRNAMAGKTHVDMVRAVYENLFGRVAEPAGVAYWANLLDKGIVTVDIVVTAVADGAGDTDLDTYLAKTAAGQLFTAALDTPAEAAAYRGSEALAAARAFIAQVSDSDLAIRMLEPAALDATVMAFVQASKAPLALSLTAGVDQGAGYTGGGGNDVFKATGATLSAGDQIDGGGGKNLLQVSDAGHAAATGLPANLMLSNIQQLDFSTAGQFGGATAADLRSVSGLQTVNVQAIGGVSAWLPHTVAATFKSTGSITVRGGANLAVDGATGAVDLSGNSLAALKLTNTNQAVLVTNESPLHAVALTVDNVGVGASVHDALAGVVTLTVTGNKPSDLGLTLEAASALNVILQGTLALNVHSGLQTLTVKGQGTLTSDLSGLATLQLFDASGFGGASSTVVAGDSNLRFVGGSGADLVKLSGALSGSANIDLGAGGDRFVVTVPVSGGATVAGGAGVDTLAVADGSWLDSAANMFSGFETLDVSAGSGTYDLSRTGPVTTVLTNTASATALAITNAAVGTVLSFVGSGAVPVTWQKDVSVALADASGDADSLTIKLTAVDGLDDGAASGAVDAESVTAAGVETLRIVSSASKLDADLPGTPGNDATQPGDYRNILRLNAHDTRTLVLGGDASLMLTPTGTLVLEKIDASAAYGRLDILQTGHASTVEALAYLGGHGADNVYSDDGIDFQGNDGGDTLSLSAGRGHDVIRFAKAADSVMPANGVIGRGPTIDSVLHFDSGTDRFDLSALHLRTGMATTALTVHDFASGSLGTLLGDGIGFFNDGTANRTIATAANGPNAYFFADTNGDGNYTAGLDMVVHLVYTDSLRVSDFIF